ncbi:MAG: ABC transporter ATP-binding protein [Oscillospiraceae bacterium]|nr:ABC transporter ATP-binding protein [Oscillospiraceae bacterium]
MNILEIKNITKCYKKNSPVLNGLSISVPAGKIVGLLGPNGCGKSTLIKLIAGLLQADSGEIYVDGQKVGEKTAAVVSYLPERPYFNFKLKVKDLLKYFSEFYSDFRIDRAEKLLSDLSINKNARLSSLSKGTKEKVQLILVMSRDAKLYLLDEPIAGVDPAARDYILGTIISNYNPEASIIITTHLITDVEQVLDEFLFMTYGGKILMGGNADATRTKYSKSLDAIFREVFKC